MNLMSSMYVVTPIILIFLSFWGILLKKKNIMFILIYMEVILVSLSILFSLLSRSGGNIFGQYYSILILTIAAVESAILICLVVGFFRGNGSVEIIALNIKNKKK